MPPAALAFRSAPRSLSDKLQELSLRSPKWMRALGVLADMELQRLNDEEQALIREAWRPRPSLD